jgi:hypothetical protein
MSWHHVPKDDACKQAHLAMLVKPGKRAGLHCDDCRHSITRRRAAVAQSEGPARKHWRPRAMPEPRNAQGTAEPVPHGCVRAGGWIE